jgi:hypothetical protein
MDTPGGKRALVGLLVLLGAGCAPEVARGPLPDDGGGAALAARVLELSPSADVVGVFDLARMRQLPEAQDLAAERFTWPLWRADAALLGLDPVDDASVVAVAAFAGSCGVIDVVTLVEPSDPALVRRVAAPDGACRAVERDPTGGEQTGVTPTRDGLLLLHTTPFGDACSLGSKIEPASASEIGWVTAETGRALAGAWRSAPPDARPVLGEAFGEDASVAWTDDRGLHVEEPAPRP